MAVIISTRLSPQTLRVVRTSAPKPRRWLGHRRSGRLAEDPSSTRPELADDGGPMMAATARRAKTAARIRTALIVTLLTACPLVLVAPAATASDTAGPRAGRYLLALGDSVSFGFQGPKVRIPPDPLAFDTGYVDVLAARDPDLDVTNLSCPGETTTTLISGGCPWTAAGWALHDSYQGSQLGAATAFLKAHHTDSGAVTVAIWGNDILALRVACNGDLACISTRAPTEIAAFAARLDRILRTLRGVAPSADIAILSASHAFPPPTPEVDALYDALNTAIADTAAASRVKVADPRALLNPPDDADRLTAICTYTLLCVTGGADAHPSDSGYVVIADAFATVTRCPGRAERCGSQSS